ncbi:ribosome recycling factor [Peptostreptococcus equinus]|uniref:Ribosome-recycling factor n=1 Tax=Peptostreptococcus equinus TaxID=3003601 RepID=A0ABY7JU47_9FIRM|nr:ribosome recycling factor [Peptostreptococcus sp. CBA3647]WAW15683.1 ribosome recycling factor [Peptostreptococcus sp. CBA3647]
MQLDLHIELEEQMEKTIEALKFEFGTIRAGRANASMLDKVRVDYYGTPTPVNQMAAVAVSEGRILTITPWDKSVIHAIEKAISESDIGIAPTNDGSVIRLTVPQLTEERRKELAKKASKASESFKVRIRNERRDANEKIKKMEKAGELAEDDAKKATDEVQKMTDKYIKTIEALTSEKEADIMSV